jgi:hypothetical protein
MRKIIFLFAFMVASVSLMAQTTQIRTNGFVNLADVTLDETTNYSYKVMQPERYYLHFQFNMDSVAGTAAETGGVFTIYGSLDGTDYNSLATTTYTAVDASADTTVFNIGTTAYGYRYLRVTYTLTDTLQCGHTIRIVSDDR